MKKILTKNNIRRASKWLLRVLIAQFVLINISAAFHAHRITHYYNDEKVRNLKSSSGTIFLRTWRLMVGRKFPKSLVTAYPQTPYDTVLLTAKNGTRLECWYLQADSSKGTVILFHGLSSNKGNVLGEAYEFISMGYNTLLVDMRAHGNSGGKSNSIGIRESEEVKLAFDYVKNRGEKNIVLWGMSLGAVIITKAVYDYDLQPQKIILEMPFDRLQDHIKARARVLNLPDEPFGFFVTFWTGAEQGYWGYGHRTSKYVKKISCPLLIQWGEEDPYVLKKEINNIFSGAGSGKKTLAVYPNTGHESLLGRNTVQWLETVNAFLK